MNDTGHWKLAISNALAYSRQLEEAKQTALKQLEDIEKEQQANEKLLKFLRSHNQELFESIQDEVSSIPEDIISLKAASWPDKVEKIMATNGTPMYIKDIVDVIMSSGLDSNLEIQDVRKRVANALAYLKGRNVVGNKKTSGRLIYFLVKRIR